MCFDSQNPQKWTYAHVCATVHMHIHQNTQRPCICRKFFFSQGCYNMLYCVVVWCSLFWCVTMFCSALQHLTSTLHNERIAFQSVCYNMSQYVAVRCSVYQHLEFNSRCTSKLRVCMCVCVCVCVCVYMCLCVAFRIPYQAFWYVIPY